MKALNKTISFLLCLILTASALPAGTDAAGSVSVWDGSVAYGFAGGSGTESDPYRIATAAQLAYLAGLVGSIQRYSDKRYYSLTADVDLNELDWTPIGSGKDSYRYMFQGTFLGNGHTISNLYIFQPAKNQQGLFGATDDATIQDLNLKNVFVYGGEEVGGIAGSLNGTVSGCTVSGEVDGSEDVGGIAGNAHSAAAVSCVNYAAVNATGSYCGGIFGWGSSGSISHCVNGGAIAGANRSGGVVGNGGSVSDCFNYGAVSGTSGVGGIAGDAKTLSNCGNVGAVSGTSSVGGVAGGRLVSASVKNCWNAGAVQGTREYGQVIGSAQSSTISYCYSPSGTGAQLGYTPSSSYANTTSNLITLPLAKMQTAAFAQTLNDNINARINRAWTQNGSYFGAFPYPVGLVGSAGQTYTVTYSAGSGSGSMADTTVGALEAYEFPECRFTAPSGYKFKAWKTGGTEYLPGESVHLTGDITVTAVWAVKPTVDECLDKLIDYILSYGESISGSNGATKYIEYLSSLDGGDSRTRIIYFSFQNSLEFQEYDVVNGFEITTVFSYDLDTHDAKDNQLSYNMKTNGGFLFCDAPFSITSYTLDTELAYKSNFDTDLLTLPLTEEQYNDLANSATRYSMTGWNYLLTKELGFGLEEIGFEAFDPRQPFISSVICDGAATQASVICSVSGAVVVCAAYDETGRMLSVSSQNVISGTSTYTFTHGAADHVTVFVLKNGAPLCRSKTK